MKLNVLINLFVLHEYLPECRRMHTHWFLANYSSVVIEVDVFSRCRKVVEGGVVRCWIVYVGCFTEVKYSGGEQQAIKQKHLA